MSKSRNLTAVMQAALARGEKIKFLIAQLNENENSLSKIKKNINLFIDEHFPNYIKEQKSEPKIVIFNLDSTQQQRLNILLSFNKDCIFYIKKDSFIKEMLDEIIANPLQNSDSPRADKNLLANPLNNMKAIVAGETETDKQLEHIENFVNLAKIEADDVARGVDDYFDIQSSLGFKLPNSENETVDTELPSRQVSISDDRFCLFYFDEDEFNTEKNAVPISICDIQEHISNQINEFKQQNETKAISILNTLAAIVKFLIIKPPADTLTIDDIIKNLEDSLNKSSLAQLRNTRRKSPVNTETPIEIYNSNQTVKIFISDLKKQYDKSDISFNKAEEKANTPVR